jgi:hypothetical protein
MTFRLALPLLCLLAAPQPAPAATNPAPAVTVYRGAMIWTGRSFRRGDLSVAGSRIVARAPRGAAVTVEDARALFIVPAYANAHSHLTSPTVQSSRSFLDAGVFYVWNPNTVVLGPDARAFFARHDTVDVKVSQGGITEPGGHPEPLYVNVLSQFVYRGRTREWFLGNAFHYGATPAAMTAALDRLVDQRADFVKAYLLHSEEYGRRRDDPAFNGSKGLNPANMPLLVREARRRGLDVVAHTETGADLLVAARTGVKVAGHLPGYAGAVTAEFRIGPDAAREVARSGMWLVPTYSVATAFSTATPRRESPLPAGPPPAPSSATIS